MQQEQDFFEIEQQQKLPGMLNTLTVLTFVGSLLPLKEIFTLSTLNEKQIDLVKKTFDNAEQANTKEAMPGFVSNIMDGAMQMLHKTIENKGLLLSCAIIGLVLCVVGAILMRKRKKIGYFAYLIGEVLYPAAVFIALGSVYFSLVNFGNIFMLIMAIIFIILYSTQLKHLNK